VGPNADFPSGVEFTVAGKDTLKTPPADVTLRFIGTRHRGVDDHRFILLSVAQARFAFGLGAGIVRSNTPTTAVGVCTVRLPSPSHPRLW
jgi:hypothetical protein